MRLSDKRAVVTGGANGIVRATATLFAREGAHVVIADVDEVGGPLWPGRSRRSVAGLLSSPRT